MLHSQCPVLYIIYVLSSLALSPSDLVGFDYESKCLELSSQTQVGGSVANPTRLLVDLRRFEHLRQLMYHIRPSNCGLCAPQA